MKKLKTFILTAIFVAAGMVTAAAQVPQSDYEIQKTFKEQYEQYQDRVDTVSSPDSAKKLIQSIRDFEQKYSSHSELLDKALYPDSFKEQMEDLKQSSVLALDEAQKYHKQTQKLEELQAQLTSYQEDLQRLNQQTDSLQKAMQQSAQSEKQLSGMVRRYRESLEKRDDLILAFIDSMVVAYQQMDMKSLQDLENIDKKSRIDSNGDALKMIHDISGENLQILSENKKSLHLQDYMRMAQVEQQFETMWNRLGDKITEVYDGENAKAMAANIDENIGKWKQMLSNQTIAALKDSLADKGIAVGGFDNGEEFYTAVNSYLDQKIEKSRKDASKATYQELQNFQEFWNRVEVDWSNNFVDAGIISKPQMATLNQKVDRWSEFAQPRSSNWMVYVLGGSVLLALALGVLLIRERSGKSGKESSSTGTSPKTSTSAG